MSYYQEKLEEIRQSIYSNQSQIDLAIATKGFIKSHSEKDLNLDLLSENLFTSKYHLLRNFKRYYGLTPRQFLIDTRIQKSKKLLAKGSSVTDTCFKVGFCSLGSFSALFKSRTGMSPTHYQKRATFKKHLR